MHSWRSSKWTSQSLKYSVYPQHIRSSTSWLPYPVWNPPLFYTYLCKNVDVWLLSGRSSGCQWWSSSGILKTVPWGFTQCTRLSYESFKPCWLQWSSYWNQDNLECAMLYPNWQFKQNCSMAHYNVRYHCIRSLLFKVF